MAIEMEPIGFVHTEAEKVPIHWRFSDLEGTLTIEDKYLEGLRDIKPGQEIVVLFHFDRSPAFSPNFLVQTPPHMNEAFGVFSICSPRRPNPIGLSVVEVLKVEGPVLYVKGIDMYDGTPILDIKPFIKEKEQGDA
ncbi:tRNA (N6-threonylcarbamoyladenosine(37)-N6)-methyltransferase TrmO [Desulforhabdus amnigena]|jgi:tRNA-Thr(GGU) m(6)t(6)A37 methyltransferase TsaA|uniref:tRNA (N6-threonylcarbamoyladenosine(37)-N6)-methyltransferase TrmO n=1 Tax=Desulforhabdus amnigena TaxID=40218 RepID=A0A9W6FV71_9BACT|nr:tRNA (N6-threonylcarbamoyladenosine(37)-N6)-methyltransferase TrmO [Desulforhabdus amnigena]NLJ28139.1 tRNA (N6-threonylcarbamoyladenosine(37)-N6)-methyltransferase TrmO [Deltaproteobacteria bacterium]GLI35469.1 tRNA (N6-threonylcarbamoyladenosine(37)-N6)-methyltransferase TrmO [Desulforhabdus amnigena]